MTITTLKKQVLAKISKAKDLKALDQIYQEYLSKKGETAKVFSSLKNLSEKQRKKQGAQANLLKKEIEKGLKEKSARPKKESRDLRIKKEKLDVTRPGKRVETGHLHPLTLVQKEATDIFQSMGFEVVQGPEVETERYNFDALNIPQDHLARDMWDTFWLKGNELLLRTHTSPMQIRYMEKHNPPLKTVVPGRVFRHEATDVSHDIQFYQLEGLMVDKTISAANFKAIIEEFLKRFLKAKVAIRLRPSYFPFVEPGFEIDVKWGKGKWLELMGAGMVHPNVFKAAGYNPKDWHGFAFGVGVDRLAMIRYKVNDIRLFYQSDLRFLKQF